MKTETAKATALVLITCICWFAAGWVARDMVRWVHAEDECAEGTVAVIRTGKELVCLMEPQ